MGENLRAIQFADGRKLKHIGNSSEWKNWIILIKHAVINATGQTFGMRMVYYIHGQPR
jgi:hypothetical protein